MKPKLLLCLALVLSGIFATQRAYGFAAIIQINHTNLTNDFSFLQIRASHIHFTNDEVVAFTVTVIPNDKLKSQHFRGTLQISDTNGLIAQTSVQGGNLLNELPTEIIPKTSMSERILFQFSVAVKYLEKSEFSVEEIIGNYPHDGPPTDYIFNLKEFADDK